MDSALKEALLVVKTTAPQYFKEATDHTVRSRPLLKMLQQTGNLMFNMRATKFVWPILVREPKVRVVDGGSRTVFDQTDAYENLEIDHAELEATDSLGRRAQMINAQSPQQIVDIIGGKMDQLVRTMSRRIGAEFYVDNSSGVNVNRMTGIQSFIKASGAATDQVAYPSSGATYGGKSIELANLGGQWSNDLGVGNYPNATVATDWPLGSGSAEYDYNSPKMLNYNADYNGDTGWSDNCLKLMRRMTEVIKRTSGEGSGPTVHILGQRLLNEFKDKIETRERNYISDYSKSMGFPSMMTYENAVVMTDFDCPSSKGFAINPSEMALYSVHSDLFFTDEDWASLEQRSVMLCGFLGNWVHKPKCTGAYVGL